MPAVRLPRANAYVISPGKDCSSGFLGHPALFTNRLRSAWGFVIAGRRPTRRAPDWRDSAAFSRIFLASRFRYPPQYYPRPPPLRITQAVRHHPLRKCPHFHAMLSTSCLSTGLLDPRRTRQSCLPARPFHGRIECSGNACSPGAATSSTGDRGKWRR
jgi:hypothetical protein